MLPALTMPCARGQRLRRDRWVYPLKSGTPRCGEAARAWKWSSFPECPGVDAAEREKRCGLTTDRVRLPVDEKARI